MDKVNGGPLLQVSSFQIFGRMGRCAVLFSTFYLYCMRDGKGRLNGCSGGKMSRRRTIYEIHIYVCRCGGGGCLFVQVSRRIRQVDYVN